MDLKIVGLDNQNQHQKYSNARGSLDELRDR
jgi:hypothetical protein